MTTGDKIALISVVIALFALLTTIWIGLYTYFRNARGTRLAHMHKLFGDYLEHEFNFRLAKVEGRPLECAEGSLRAFKMYTLEEMWLWLQSEKRRPPWRGQALQDHERLVEGWTNTIDYHIGEGTLKELIDFLSAHRCYSPGFVSYVLERHLYRDNPKVVSLRQKIESSLRRSLVIG